jgi:hypothetical protein
MPRSSGARGLASVGEGRARAKAPACSSQAMPRSRSGGPLGRAFHQPRAQARPDRGLLRARGYLLGEVFEELDDSGARGDRPAPAGGPSRRARATPGASWWPRSTASGARSSRASGRSARYRCGCVRLRPGWPRSLAGHRSLGAPNHALDRRPEPERIQRRRPPRPLAGHQPHARRPHRLRAAARSIACAGRETGGVGVTPGRLGGSDPRGLRTHR